MNPDDAIGKPANAGRARIAAAWIACPLSWSSSSEVAEPAGLVRREDPRRAGPPATAAVGIHAAIHRERHRDRRSVGAREDVVLDPQAGRVGPERRQRRIVERPQPLDRDAAHPAVAPRRRSRTSDPTARSGAGPATPRQASRIDQSIGSSGTSGRPIATALASIGDPRRSHRRAVALTSSRYGLRRPPSPSIERQTGASASKWRRRSAGSSSRSVVRGRSAGPCVSEPTRTALVARP